MGNKLVHPNQNQGDKVLEKTAIAVPLKYLSNFWRSFKMPLINCKFN